MMRSGLAEEQDVHSAASSSSDHTSSTSSTAAVATPSRKYRSNNTENKDKSDQSDTVIHNSNNTTPEKAVPAETTLSPSGASVATAGASLGVNGGNILDQKKLRKRMALMELERNKNLGGNYQSVKTKASLSRPFAKVQHDKAVSTQAKQAVAGSSSNPRIANLDSQLSTSIISETSRSSSTTDFSAVASDHVSELRRRRVYEMHHHRPYSSHTKPKKKFKFWEQEKPTPVPFVGRGGGDILNAHPFLASTTPNDIPRIQPPPVSRQGIPLFQNNAPSEPRRVSSFSDLSSPEARRHYREVTFQDDNMLDHSFRCCNSSYEFDASWIHPGGTKHLLQMKHMEERCEDDDDDEEEEDVSDIPLHVSPRRALWNERASALQTQMQKLVLGGVGSTGFILSSRSEDDKDEIMDGLVYDSDEIMTPVKDRKYITQPFTTTKKHADKCSAEAYKRKENRNGNNVKIPIVSPDASTIITPLATEDNALLAFETPEKATTFATQEILTDVSSPQIIPNLGATDEMVFSAPNAPKKERIHRSPSKDEVEQETDNHPSSSMPIVADSAIAKDTSNNIQTEDRNEPLDTTPMTAVKLSINPRTCAIQWETLRRDETGEVTVTKRFEEKLAQVSIATDIISTIRALTKQKSCDSANADNKLLTLFVNLFQESTYEEMAESIPEIKNQRWLVFCRGFDFSASTYRTASELRSLLGALKNVYHLDSLMLLRLCPESMVDLAKTVNQHPSLFRVQLHLEEGSLSGELLGVMAASPRLTHLRLDLKGSCAIGTLMNSKSLQALRLDSKTSEIAKSHFRTLIYGLGSNQTMTTLDLAPEISLKHFRSMCVALKENRRLECLRVSLMLENSIDSQIATMELANLLKVNRSLLTVWNHLYEESSPPNYLVKTVLQDAIRKNGSIREIRMFREESDDSWLCLDENEEQIMGIQPRQRDVIYNHYDEPSVMDTTCSDGNSYVHENGDWMTDSKLCDMLQSVPDSCSDCIIPDIGDAFRK